MQLNIESERLLIRAFRTDDAEDLQEILGDEQTMTNVEPPYEPEKTKSFLQNFCIERGWALACCLRDGGKLIGYILFNESEADVYELGWIFNRGYWRQGYAFEALSALLRCAFEELGAHKLFAETTDREKSVKLMKKLGMKCEGVQRAHTRNNAGQWCDMQLYGLLREEYAAGG